MTAVDLTQLGHELDAAGVPYNGLYTTDGTLESVCTLDDDPVVATFIPLPPEADPILAAHDPTRKTRTAAFESQEDAERLALVAERAQTDPAFAALAELTLPR